MAYPTGYAPDQPMDLGVTTGDGTAFGIRKMFQIIQGGPAFADLPVPQKPLPGTGWISVRAWGAVGDGVTDDTAAIQVAIDIVQLFGGTLFFPAGVYLVTAPLNFVTIGAASSNAVLIKGAGPRSTIIAAQISGAAVFDCVGTSFLKFEDFAVSGNASFTPTCCWLLARNSTGGSAGDHIFDNVQTLGYFSTTVIYNYSSEIVKSYNCQFANNAVGASIAVHTATNIKGLTSTYATIATGAISNRCFAFFGCEMTNFASSGNNDCLYLDGSVLCEFMGGYMMTAAGRAFVYIDASVASTANLALRDTMWDGGNTTYGVTVVGAVECTRPVLDNIQDIGVKPFTGTVTAPTGGIVVYGQDGSTISNARITNLYSTTCLYFRFYQINYSRLDFGGGDTVYWKYACSGNQMTVHSALLTVDRLDFATGNAVTYLDTGSVSNLRDGTTTWDPASIANGASLLSPAIAITGLTFGMSVQVLAPYDLQGVSATGQVSSAGNAKILLQNSTGGAVDLGSGSWKVKGTT